MSAYGLAAWTDFANVLGVARAAMVVAAMRHQRAGP
jgi:hypothetical protein